jgi:hypothetical protein
MSMHEPTSQLAEQVLLVTRNEVYFDRSALLAAMGR